MRHEPMLRVLRAAGRYRHDRWRIGCTAVLLGFLVGWIAHLYHVPAPALADDGVRCYARLPAVSGDWNTVLAQCDGRPVAIGAVPQSPDADTRLNPTANSAEYAQDMQAIRGVLISAPSPTPKWVIVAAMLLGLALIAGLVLLLRGLLRAIFRLKTWIKARRSVQALAKNNADAMSTAIDQGADLRWD